jgi:hypothetical protein
MSCRLRRPTVTCLQKYVFFVILYYIGSLTVNLKSSAIYVNRIFQHPSLNPRNRVYEKLIVAQLMKKSSVFYGTRIFITVFSSTCHWNLSWASWIQYTTSRLISVILSSHLRLQLPSGNFPSGYPTKILACTHFTSLIHATCPAHLISFCLITLIICDEEFNLLNCLSCNFLHLPVTSYFFWIQIFCLAFF